MSAASPIEVTFFTDYAAQQQRRQSLTAEALAALIRDTTAKAKAALPWLKLCRFGDRRTEKGSLRHDSNVAECNGLEADYDSEVVTFDEAVEILDKAGVHAIVYTSPSHVPEKPRWRVLCPFSSPLPPRERVHMMGRLNGLFRGTFSAESWALSQAYYFGSVNGNPAHRVEIVEGTQYLDQCDELDEISLGKPDTKLNDGNSAGHAKNGPLDESRLIEAIIGGQSYHVSCTRLLGRWAQQGVAFMDAQRRLLDYFDEVFPPDRNERWQQRRNDVPRLVRDIYGKQAEQRDAAAAGDGGHHQQQVDLEIDLLAGTHWLTRDIPEPDFLLGELLSTTSRIELIGPTGIGKTNVLVALALAVAHGRDFLHWRGSGKPCRVLYVDGEMSRRLTKKRLADAARRHGCMPTTFYCLNREDFPDLPPLNTEAGQKFVDAVIKAIGGADCAIFDNVQALLSGDMKDEVPWQQTLPWVRDLTRRSIGQAWAHHTGHDETHGYGSKAREWQLDTVALLERFERPEADIAFKLSFTKSRERTPDNRADFEPAVITLANDKWLSERGEHVRARKKPKGRALELLIDAIAREGVIPPASGHIPPDTTCVTEGRWRTYCDLGCISEGKPNAQRMAFKRAADALLQDGKIRKWDLWCWPVR